MSGKDLMLAVQQQNIDLLKLLLEAGNLDGINDYYGDPEKEAVTPLIAAIKLGNLEMIQLLLLNGGTSSVNTPTIGQYAGITPLAAAIECGNLEIVKLLLENGAGKPIDQIKTNKHNK